MASKLMTLVAILSRRGGIVRTSTAPNSWAAAAWWKRFFEENRQAEEEQAEDTCAQMTVESSSSDVIACRDEVEPVIASPAVMEARIQFAKEYMRNLMEHDHLQQQPQSFDTPLHVLFQPNRQIPVGDEFLYRAQ